jgi:hypothetical protein
MRVRLGAQSTRVRARLSLVTAGIMVAVLLSTSSVSASGATISSYAYSNTYTSTEALGGCLFPDILVSGTVTEFGHGQIIETDQGVTVHSEDDMTYHLVFPDGRYLDGNAQSHATFNAHGTVSIYTDPVVEPRTYYSADGVKIGTMIIHYIGHITYDGSTGDVTAGVDRFFLTCM